MATILIETDLDVVSKQRLLVEEALGPDSVYIRMKETLIDLMNSGEIKGTDRAKVVGETIAQMSASITANVMSTGLQWAEAEKRLALQKEEMQKQLDILEQNKLLITNQVATSLAEKQVKQAQLIREYGIATKDANGNVTALDNSGKEYASIQNIVADTSNKAKQADVLDATKQQTWAQTHKIVADTYVNHGVFSWTGLSATGISNVSKTNTGYVTLSDLQKQVSKEQARGYVYNAWSNAASAGASMLGTLAGAEIESIDSTSWAEMINLWKIPTQKLGESAAPTITI
ncbi:MAG: hypothetical protein ACMV1B_09195 [Prevotella sp.]